MRECNVTMTSKENVEHIVPCYFHQWGLDACEDNNGNFMWTVGIVETNAGTVIKVNPEKIIFTDVYCHG